MSTYYKDEEVGLFSQGTNKTSIRNRLLAVIAVTIIIALATWAIVASVFMVKWSNRTPVIGPPVVDDDPFVLDIITFNDVYELEPVQITSKTVARGGSSRAAAYINSVRAKRSNSKSVLVLSGGDMISPSLMSTEFKGEQMIATNNLLGLNYSVLGNHEFDFDVPVLEQRVLESKFAWINSNVDNLPISSPENVVFDFMPGVKIGLFGVLLQFGPFNTSVVVRNPFQSAAEQVQKLKSKGATFIIALSHMAAIDNCALAQVSGIDLIVAGHDHIMKMDADCGGPAYVTATQDWRDLWHIRVNFNYTTPVLSYNNIPMTLDKPTDPTMDTLIQTYKKKIGAVYNVVIAKTLVELEGRSNYLRTRETNLGNYVTDTIKNYSNASIAFFNGGTIRCNKLYPVGFDIKKGDVVEMLPFSNSFTVLSINATILKLALENGVSGVEINSGKFPVVSGFRYVYRLKAPAFSRIVNVTVLDPKGSGVYVPLTDDMTFTMVTNSFMAGGGDGYDMLPHLPVIVSDESGIPIQMIVRDRIIEEKVMSPVLEGRVTQV
ncbi:5'-nucleotidase [Acrasis kona]|uniref:5'-nucleotidase n=1 Tax=Acrasis kona TaxID=1008807 RepID=A0AAW2ZIS2_9EUKA